MTLSPALIGRLESAAREVGRFRQRVQADPALARCVFLADRLAWDIEVALWIILPSAGELAAQSYPGDDEAAAAALEAVDARHAQIRKLLGDRSKW